MDFHQSVGKFHHRRVSSWHAGEDDLLTLQAPLQYQLHPVLEGEVNLTSAPKGGMPPPPLGGVGRGAEEEELPPAFATDLMDLEPREEPCNGGGPEDMRGLAGGRLGTPPPPPSLKAGARHSGNGNNVAKASTKQTKPNPNNALGKGRRTQGQDPRLDPSVDPKRARRILANRLSAARSKERQKEHLNSLERREQSLKLGKAKLMQQISSFEDQILKQLNENAELTAMLERVKGRDRELSAQRDRFMAQIVQACGEEANKIFIRLQQETLEHLQGEGVQMSSSAMMMGGETRSLGS